MIYHKIDADSYKESFSKKFTNFAEKAPIVISFAMDDIGVTVAHENSGKKYFYPWDYVVPVKSFIHDIKRDLVSNHYPRIQRVVHTKTPLTSEEIADMLAKGVTSDDIPDEVEVDKIETYRIDKIIVMRDEFILVDEDTNEQYCYHMNSSAFSYLRTYREGGFKDLFEAGDVFFKKSSFIGKLDKLAD